MNKATAPQGRMKLKDWRQYVAEKIGSSITQEDMANWMGVTYEAYRKMESGHTRVRQVHKYAVLGGMGIHTQLRFGEALLLIQRLDVSEWRGA